MRLVLDEYLASEPIERRGDEDGDETRKERYRCPTCGEESFWAILDLHRPVAGCVGNGCPVGARMGLLETLEFLWDGDLPEDATDRRRVLARKLGDLSSRALEAEDEFRRSSSEHARRWRESLEKERDGWKEAAEREEDEAAAWKGRAGELEETIAALRARLESRAEGAALSRGLAWGAVALAAGMMWMEVFLARAGTEMVFAWGFLRGFSYMAALGGSFAFLAFAAVYRDAKEGGSPTSLRERLGWRMGLGWSGKIAACVVAPYILVGMVGGSGFLAGLLPRDGVEWLLVSTVSGMSCALALCAWMAEDLR